MSPFAESIVHLDMDAFFVEVERIARPELVGRPVLVGGTGSRSVVAAASYEARRRGAHSAMPMVHARRLVPDAIVVPPDHDAYRKVSDDVFAVLRRHAPIVEPLSIDEAFLDISGLHLHHASPAACGESVRRAIKEEIGLPSSVGVATSKFIAKMASRAAKPDGLLVVAAGEELSFLHPKPVEDLWGVGEATRARIAELGVVTIGDLASYPRETLVRRLGVAVGGSLWDLAHARDDRRVEDVAASRSLSVEETFEVDLRSQDAMERELLALSDRLAGRLRGAGVVASSVHLKVRYPDFTTVSRSHTFVAPIVTSSLIYRAAVELLGATDALGRGVRLLGVGADGLAPADQPRQLTIDTDPWEAVDQAVDLVRDRFGGSAVGRARLAAGRREPDEAAPSGTKDQPV